VSSIHKAIKIRFDRGGRTLCNSLAQQCTWVHDDSNRSRSHYSLENNTITGGTELCKSAELGPRVHGGCAIALHFAAAGRQRYECSVHYIKITLQRYTALRTLISHYCNTPRYTVRLSDMSGAAKRIRSRGAVRGGCRDS